MGLTLWNFFPNPHGRPLFTTPPKLTIPMIKRAWDNESPSAARTIYYYIDGYAHRNKMVEMLGRLRMIPKDQLAAEPWASLVDQYIII